MIVPWVLIYLFFFSSRRRHTRLVSDWSSDVCSSDLGTSPGPRFFNSYGPGEVPGKYRNVIPNFFYWAMNGRPLPITGTGEERSEERRVGKERRCRWRRWQ